MPEGPEIRRVADALDAALVGRKLSEVWFSFPELEARCGQIIGAKVRRIETRGKALLTHFSSGLTLYSHNQLYGRWVISDAGAEKISTRSPRVRLANPKAVAVLYSASDIELWPTERIEEHPFLQRIGPDVLDAHLTPDAVAARLLEPAFRGRRLGALLLDQHFLAGLGNYLRAEILWTAELPPERTPSELTAQQLGALANACLEIARRSYRTRGRETALGDTPEEFQFQVFRREGEARSRCGATIERSMSASRPLYFCPRCQASG